MTKFAKPEEIQSAHSILLKNKPYFEQDKIDIIECNESRDVKACPGSGKTTTLLAKLIILANRMPLPNNQGICVLTHTNVAIDEIKSKLGHKADILFRYPNHFGTIQSFVDKFLAIPYFSIQFKKKPSQISNDAYLKNFDRSLKMKLRSIKIDNNALFKRMWSYILSNEGLLNNIRLTIIDSDFQLLDISTNSVINFKKPKRGKKYFDWSGEEKEEMKKLMTEVILNVYNYYSSISYYDAYTLSTAYVLQKPDIMNAISSRFKYLFIDEMQDTDKHQLDIINSIFDLEKTIVQCFGDHHQAIFNKIKSEELWTPSNALQINGSKRFGENIANVLRSVCLEKNDMLIANPTIDSLTPTIIVFDNPLNVLPKFCELLKIKEIDSKTIWSIAQEEKISAGDFSNKIKAVGWVGSSNSLKRTTDGLTIKSYYNNFNSQIKKKDKVDYDSLKSFLRRQNGSNVKDYSNKIVEALLHVLSIANKKYSNGKNLRNFTKTSLLEYFANKSIEEFNLFNTNVAKWAKSIHNSEGFCDTTIAEVKSFIIKTFYQIFEIDSTNQYISQFLNSSPTNMTTDDEVKSNNIFENNGVEVEIATIHSVKGETHIATLYLETSYQGEHESQRIMEQLKGNYYVPPRKKDVYKKETLKMTHVGMSRPKYFLCMAIHRDRFDDALDINNGGIWEIVNA
jgi:superfamily I DNA/RNA helicase